MPFSLFYELLNENILLNNSINIKEINKEDYNQYIKVLDLNKKEIPFFDKFKYFILNKDNLPVALFSFKKLKVDDAGHRYANIRIASNYNLQKFNYFKYIAEYLINKFKFNFLVTTVYKDNEKLKTKFIKYGGFINDKDENYNERRLNFLNQNKTMLIYFKK